jgi:hypothetical protein
MKRLHLQKARLPITLKDRILKQGSLTVCPAQIFLHHDYDTANPIAPSGKRSTTLSEELTKY